MPPTRTSTTAAPMLRPSWSALGGGGPKIDQRKPPMAPARAGLAFLLILVGFGAKVGLVPLHTWLPDAHSQAPSPVCALLSGVETSVVLYVILRLLPILHAVPGQRLESLALAVGLSFAFLKVNIVTSALTIGLVCFWVTATGFLLGRKVGTLVGERAETLGGIVLIGIGVKILLSHLL